MATQNPIEQEGTYPLPEAQLDRFLLHVRVDYPDIDTEKAILALNRSQALDEGETAAPRRVSQTQVFEAGVRCVGVHGAAAGGLSRPFGHGDARSRRYSASLEGWLRFGASPRATLALDRCARALAWLDGRDFVTPDDIQRIAPDCLRHRLLLGLRGRGRRPRCRWLH
jgi:MoxR-like ATPase